MTNNNVFPPGLPFSTEGQVVKGFGRGSKDLGIPTANFPDDVVEQLPAEIRTGIYYGFAKLSNDSAVYKMVMSIGWNPFYKNTKKSMETHILHDFQRDFYGSHLKVCILGYIRPEQSYDSLDALIAAIKSDISFATSQLDLDKFSAFKNFNGLGHEHNGHHSNL